MSSNIPERIIKDEFEGFLLPSLSKAQRERIEEQIISLRIPFSKVI